MAQLRAQRAVGVAVVLLTLAAFVVVVGRSAARPGGGMRSVYSAVEQDRGAASGRGRSRETDYQWVRRHATAAELNALGGNGWTPAELAVLDARLEMVKAVLERGADVRRANRRGRTLLHLAAGRGRHDVVELLLQHGASVEARDRNGWTALHHAALDGDRATLVLLLGHGADPHATDADGRTPADLARTSRRPDNAEFLRRRPRPRPASRPVDR